MNLRSSGRKVTALVLLLLVSLAVVGVAYAMWDKTLTIEGTVNTGDVDAEWTFVSSGDPPGAIDPGYDKDVGELTCEIDGTDPQILHFTVNNGYPSYTADCEVEFNNTGTIPWIVEAISIIPGMELTGCVLVGPNPAGSQELQCDQLTITYIDALCTQVDPGDPFGLASSIRIHVEQPAEENWAYTFDVEVLLVQWNESACP